VTGRASIAAPRIEWMAANVLLYDTFYVTRNSGIKKQGKELISK